MKKSSKTIVIAAASLLSLVSVALPSRADTIAYTTSGTETDLGAYGLSGFEFTLTSNIDVTALGFTALSIGGGDAPHVTLWNATAGLGALTQIYDTGNINGSVTSTGQGTGTGTPSFVSVGAIPITLTVGQTYLVTAPAYWASTFNSTSGGTTVNSVFATSSFLTANSGWNGWPNSGYTFSNLTAAPAGSTPTVANLEFTTAGVSLPVSVPEPSTYISLGAGLLVLLIRLRRKSSLPMR
jgi:hypothetical protein